MKYPFVKKFKEGSKKVFSVYMILTLLFQLGFPSVSMALTGGPSQPEVQSFTPVGTSEMVDPFSGDFTYNIPLMDVDGYPVNISYHSGIQMDQEASWVGLGWNINPGVISRMMRGVPDDYDGEEITKEFNMKPNVTFGLIEGGGIEVVGADLPFGLSLDYTLHFNNYTGIGLDQSVAGHISASGRGVNGTASLGITSSSSNGLSLQPNLSLSYSQSLGNRTQASVGFSIGASYNSRAGLQQITMGVRVDASVTNMKTDMATGNTSGAKGGGGVNFTSTYNPGMPVFTPELTLPFLNVAISGSFKEGPEEEGVNEYDHLGGYFSSQSLTVNTLSQPAYGYLNADEGVKFDNAVMDFNREKDVPFSPSIPALAIPNFSYDILTVTGQGIGGSYRPFRSDFGQVFSPYVSNTSGNGSLGIELGEGVDGKIGVDVAVSSVTSESGRWDNSDGSNAATGNLYYTQHSSDPTYERYYYKEANEKSVDADSTYLQRAGGFTAQRLALNQVSEFNTNVSSNFTSGIVPSGTRAKREKRKQTIATLTKGELNNYGLTVDPNLYAAAPSYHNAEITSYAADGKRYVYGIAAYNTRQEETTFAVGTDEFGTHSGLVSTLDPVTGLISYNPGDNNTIHNGYGLDNYYSNTIMPAYAHSYLLTAVLSPDYVDIDSIRGPSVNDLGTYTLFHYAKTDPNYHWRIPCEFGKASFNEGLKWTTQDDKANYVYGEKELWYLQSIETKNYMAVFDLAPRDDGYGVLGKDGGLNLGDKMQLLNKISLYTKVNYNAHAANPSVILNPIKEVHFEYDYSLCQGIPNFHSLGGGSLGTGKLTLKKISFSYQESAKGRLSPYTFTYDASNNPIYNSKATDRWGYYNPQWQGATGVNTSNFYDPINGGLSNAEYPYTNQNPATQDNNARAWSLTDIGLPSGGSIHVDYESDDYAYVQNVPATQMFKVVGSSSNGSNGSYSGPCTSPDIAGKYIVVQLPTPLTGPNRRNEFYNQYLSGLSYLYFRFLYGMAPGTYDYVPGYVPSNFISDWQVDISGQYAYIKLNTVTLNDNGGGNVNPITKAAVQYARLNEPKNVYNSIGGINSGSNFGLSILTLMLPSLFINIADAAVGPNKAIYSNHGCCQNFVGGKSWIRLNNPNQHKKGGGTRVTKIQVSDQWNGMTAGSMPSFSYGQEYSYNNEDGSSSGVASYEPQIGGEENPLRTPAAFDITHSLAPNDELYLETPFGESFFPSPSVGYGRVTVKNLQYANVNSHASGEAVYEFWTAKDFPTITSRTDLDAIREKTDFLSLSSLLGFDVKDYMTVSQGFYVENNDMHGKPKGQKVYQQGITQPISSIEYDYQKTPYGTGSYRLDNMAKVVAPDGTTSTQNLGVFFDIISDFRQEHTNSTGGSLGFNLDLMEIVFPVPIFTIWPGYDKEDTRFRSAVTAKHVNRFGLLDKVIVKDLGSTVETDNLAYDSETGDVLLTQTKNDYDDAMYSFNFPAYWFYNGMGPAYQNIDIGFSGITFNAAGIANITNASTYFNPGDEIEMNGSTSVKAWLLAVSPTTIRVEKKDGMMPAPGTYSIKIIRPGKRNMLSDNMASLVTQQNPLSSLGSNSYQEVINAAAIEYNDQWSIFCSCLSDYKGNDPSASYATGARGNWRPKRNFAYLGGRSQSRYDGNTNTRKDGMFTSFNPLYKLTGAKWQLDTTNWTFTTKVTQVNPNWQELENVDALGRYSAASYGYNQTFATAVSANARFREIGFDNGEDYDLKNCADNHFKFPGATIDATESHTGDRSIKVSGGTFASMMQVLKVSSCNVESPCQVNISSNCHSVQGVSPLTNCQYSFSGQGLVAPITISWVITSGNPTISLSGGMVNVVNVGSQPWSAILTVSGAGGCSQKFPIKNVNSN